MCVDMCSDTGVCGFTYVGREGRFQNSLLQVVPVDGLEEVVGLQVLETTPTRAQSMGVHLVQQLWHSEQIT